MDAAIERELKTQLGRTVGDARRLLARAQGVQLAVRITRTEATFLTVSKMVFLKSISYRKDGEPLPSALRQFTDEIILIVGSIAAIDHFAKADSA